MANADLHVEVAYSLAAGQTQQIALTLPAGSTVGDALRQAGPEWVASDLVVGVWGKLRHLDDELRDQDRVEIYRPLLVDPKEARRQRHQSHRAKAKP